VASREGPAMSSDDDRKKSGAEILAEMSRLNVLLTQMETNRFMRASEDDKERVRKMIDELSKRASGK
jgi:hypothetical protein